MARKIIPWVTTDWVFPMFSSRVNRARQAYREFVKQGKDGGIQGKYGKGSDIDPRVLGDEIFVDKVLGQSKERSRRWVTVKEIVSHVCKQFS